MSEFSPYDDWDYTEDELVAMAMGNPVGEAGLSMETTRFNFTNVQKDLISRALSEYDEFDSDLEREVAHRTEEMIRDTPAVD